ncbi:aldose 1-epimerase [Hydrogenispora ethanolica]|jgi:aldose 1-epimerase|uniref:Aldose 1-epimerase n=1 Tax=Hydrogenispora ethanolica TaxID=1082276 RepID=A0A4R1SA55_HYDET|nr:aldose 1-epimerase [Hydrogenispora ethanolica]TCL76385.1 aldose 1-epimerase [Hydrogenispora ethanolica]
MSEGPSYPAGIERSVWQGEPVVRLRAGGYEAVLVPGVGAQIIELRELRRGLELLRPPVAVDLEAFKARPQIYGLPLLFPPNRIEDGKLPIAGRAVELPVNDAKGHNHIHGFLRTRPWQLTRAEIAGDAVEAEAVFRGDGATDSYAAYLNQFEFKQEYVLSGAGLRQRLTVTNRAAVALPLGVGFHTAFRVPFHPESSAADCRLLVSVGRGWELTERILPTGKLLPLNEHDRAYRSGGAPLQGTPISGHFTAEELTVDGRPFHGAIIEDRSKGLRVVYTVDRQYRHWMLWNDDGASGFFCPEPQTWAINAPNLDLAPELTGYQELQPGASWTAESAIAVREV